MNRGDLPSGAADAAREAQRARHQPSFTTVERGERFPRGRRSPQAVADASDVDHPTVPAAGLELAPEPTRVACNGPGRAARAIAPDAAKELVGRKNPVGINGEVREQVELPPSQREDPPIEARGVRGEIDRQRPELKQTGGAARALGAAEKRT